MRSRGSQRGKTIDMPKLDPRVDAYIDKSPDFAKPILTHLRKLVHIAVPESEETIKWSVPSFDYKGPFCSMAAFKAHCIFGFWKTALIPDPKGLLTRQAMGSFGRITSVKDLPSDKVIMDFIKAAKKLNDEGVKLPPIKKTTAIKPLVIPEDFTEALKKDKKANATFEAFSPSHKKEYVEWITEAKTEETRARRMATALEWLAEGKARHWKYQG
jgi:uncharacterized protein YdeI (YjbR/CyaY-like superfamily)